jgi:hypothetical protein
MPLDTQDDVHAWDSDIELDINHVKVVEWIVDRNLVPKDWKRRLEVLQGRVGRELERLEGSRVEEPYTYTRCVQVLENLKIERGDDKNLLGSFKDGSVYTWDTLRRAYESSLLHVAEAGLTLQRLDFEINHLRKQVNRYQQQIEDLGKKRGDLMKQGQLAAQHFASQCSEIGVSASAVHLGQDAIESELLMSARKLPRILQGFSELIQTDKFVSAITYYDVLSGGSTVVPHLSQLVQKQDSLDFPKADNSLCQGWVDTKHAHPTPTPLNSINEIAWDGLEIDCDHQDRPWEDSSIALENSWGIDVVDVGDVGSRDDISMLQPRELPNTAEAAAKALLFHLESFDNRVQRLVVDRTFRSSVYNELLELKAFLSRRIKEEVSTSCCVAQQNSTFPDVKEADTMKDLISIAADILVSEDVSFLDDVVRRGAHRGRMANRLLRQSQRESRLVQEAEGVIDRKEDTQNALISANNKMTDLLTRAKDARTVVENGLRAKLGRPILVRMRI